MDFQKYYNDYVGLSPLGKEELMDTFFEELFQEGNVRPKSSKKRIKCLTY